MALTTTNTMGSCLTVLELRAGAKNRHPTAVCLCSCGSLRIVRQTCLRRGLVASCAQCSKMAGAIRGGLKRRLPESERRIRETLGIYKANARAKGHLFDLGDSEARALLWSACVYCGLVPANGIDRVENAIGYTPQNAVPCCSRCNYGKRDMSVSEFLSWVARVNEHQGVLQRDRSVRLQLVEQPNGRRSDNAGADR